MSQQPPMTLTSASTINEIIKYDIDDIVVSNQTLVISSVTLPQEDREDEKSWSGTGPEEPMEVVIKDSDPPDGGYGWIVVAYLIPLRLVLMVVLLVC
jgi:hypothetical protein